MLKIVKIKGSYVNGEVCSHCLSEVLIMMLKKCIACGMRCMSICIAVVIFLLSAQSKLPIPETVSFPGLDKFLHACAFGSFAFTLSYWFSTDKWLGKPLKYCTIVKFLFPGAMLPYMTGLPTVPERF